MQQQSNIWKEIKEQYNHFKKERAWTIWLSEALVYVHRLQCAICRIFHRYTPCTLPDRRILAKYLKDQNKNSDYINIIYMLAAWNYNLWKTNSFFRPKVQFKDITAKSMYVNFNSYTCKLQLKCLKKHWAAFCLSKHHLGMDAWLQGQYWIR
jgi:hypothetical protein